MIPLVLSLGWGISLNRLSFNDIDEFISEPFFKKTPYLELRIWLLGHERASGIGASWSDCSRRGCCMCTFDLPWERSRAWSRLPASRPTRRSPSSCYKSQGCQISQPLRLEKNEPRSLHVAVFESSMFRSEFWKKLWLQPANCDRITEWYIWISFRCLTQLIQPQQLAPQSLTTTKAQHDKLASLTGWFFQECSALEKKTRSFSIGLLD